MPSRDDLAAEICKRPGIETASVHLDIDKPGGFREKVITALASVKPAGSRQLDKAEVVAIRRLVAGAVAGLKPEDVTVADLNGPTWCRDADEAAGGENRNISPRPADGQEPKAGTLIPSEQPAVDLREAALDWINRSRGTLSMIGLALVALLGLRSVVRSATAAGARRAMPVNRTPRRPATRLNRPAHRDGHTCTLRIRHSARSFRRSSRAIRKRPPMCSAVGSEKVFSQ